MKTCNKCKEEKPFNEFAKNKAKKDGLQGMCRPCKKTTDHIHHQNNREAQNARNKANWQIRYDYAVMRKSIPCMDCGQSFPPIAMDFDHVRGTKIANVSEMVKNIVSMETLIEEIEKCDVVCAVCHRIRTGERYQMGL